MELSKLFFKPHQISRGPLPHFYFSHIYSISNGLVVSLFCANVTRASATLVEGFPQSGGAHDNIPSLDGSKQTASTVVSLLWAMVFQIYVPLHQTPVVDGF